MAQKSGLINTQLNIELRQLLENRGINADKIVVFGSYGRGDKREDSDIDLIIVSKNFRNKSIFERVELTSGINHTFGGYFFDGQVTGLRIPINSNFENCQVKKKGEEKGETIRFAQGNGLPLAGFRVQYGYVCYRTACLFFSAGYLRNLPVPEKPGF